MSSAAWRKSSFSDGNDGNCVEVSRRLDRLRDTKNRGQVLTADVARLAAWLRSGR